MKSDIALRNAVIDVVCGSAPWYSLTAVGVEIRRSEGSWSFPTPPPTSVSATLFDVARGFRAMRKSPQARTEWASFLLAAAGLLSFEELAESPEGETVLAALWDTSAGLELDERTWRLIDGIASEA